MGLDYNYLLYFQQSHLWDAVQGLVTKCETIDPHPTTIRFPDHDLILPIATDLHEEKVLSYDKPDLGFAISMIFKEDDAIQDYIINRGDEWIRRAPPDPDGEPRVSIGYIYLTIYTDLSKHFAFEKPEDFVLFKFGTTGTKMSLLFSESESIRRTFIELLESYHGVSGVFDREYDGGEVFWWKGLRVCEYVEDTYIHPDGIEAILRRNWGRGKDDVF